MRRVLVIVATILGTFSTTMVGSASADVADGGAAVISNTLEIAEGGVWINTVWPPYYCDIVVTGSFTTQRLNYGIGEIFGTDTAAAVGDCSSLNLTPYTLTVTVEIQYFSNGWHPIPGTHGLSVSPSTLGSAQGIARGNGVYPGGSPYLNRYHRAYGCVSFYARTTCRPSPNVWFMSA